MDTFNSLLKQIFYGLYEDFNNTLPYVPWSSYDDDQLVKLVEYLLNGCCKYQRSAFITKIIDYFDNILSIKYGPFLLYIFIRPFNIEICNTVKSQHHDDILEALLFWKDAEDIREKIENFEIMYGNLSLEDGQKLLSKLKNLQNLESLEFQNLNHKFSESLESKDLDLDFSNLSLYLQERFQKSCVPSWVTSKIYTSEELKPFYNLKSSFDTPSILPSPEQFQEDILSRYKRIDNSLLNNHNDKSHKLGRVYAISFADEKRDLYECLVKNVEGYTTPIHEKNIFQTFGPVNPLLTFEHGINIECYNREGCRMLTCKCFETSETSGDDDEIDWFTGKCDICDTDIDKPCYALRFPYPTGGWKGCLCSWDHVLKYAKLINYSDEHCLQILKIYEKQLEQYPIFNRE